jgi:hypothetical protein
VIVLPAVAGYLAVGSDGILPGLAVGIVICLVVVLWFLRPVTGDRCP